MPQDFLSELRNACQTKAKGRTLLSLSGLMEKGLVSLLLPTSEHFRSRLGNQQSSQDGAEPKKPDMLQGGDPFPSPGFTQLQPSKENGN